MSPTLNQVMRRLEFPEVVRRDGTALVTTAAKEPTAAVSAVPGWDLADVLRHLGAEQRLWTAAIREGGTDRPQVDVEEPGDDQLADWAAEGVDDLAAAIEDSDPEAPAWGWWDERRVRYVARRAAVHTALHRWDAQEAVGESDRLDPLLASAGVDEYARVFVPATEQPWEYEHATVHLRRSDGRGHWAITVDPQQGQRRWARDDAAVVRGHVSDLLLVLWRRLPLDTVRMTGDRDIVAALIDHTDLRTLREG